MQKTKKRLTALSLAVLLLVALACGGVAAWAAGANTLKVSPAPADNTEYLADLDGQVVVDVYQIATAELDGQYVKYNYHPLESGVFKDLKLDDETQYSAAFWNDLAVEAANLVEKTTDHQTLLANGNDSLSQLDDGLYLILPHGSDVPLTYEGNILSSLYAHGKSGAYDYRFSPYIIAAPTAEDETGAATTAGAWTSDVTATLKPERTQGFGSLRIEKIVNNRNGYKVVPTTFAFHVTDTATNGEVYDNYAEIFYNGGTPEPAVLTQIPVGIEVNVEEVVLNQATWGLTTENNLKRTIMPDGEGGPVSVSFTNDYIPPNGHGVQNTFEAQKTGEGEDAWDWKLIKVTPESAQTEPPSNE